MRLWLGIASLLFLVSGTVSDDFGFNLEDAFDDPPKPTEKPKSNDPPKVTAKPKSNDGELDLLDAFGPDPDTDKPKSRGGDAGGADIPDILDFGPPKATKKPAAGDDSGFNLDDALGPDPDPKPKKPTNPRQGGGGGGSFGLDDLQDVAGDDYKPDKGSGGSRPQDPGYDPHGGAGDQPQEAGSGQIAGIASAIGVALLGAASSYFAYQKKKLCFKLQGGVDPESGKGHHGTHSEPQVLSNLLRSS